MALNEPRHSADDREVISYEAMVNGKPVLVALDRETIEDYLEVETTTPEERLTFVNQNMAMLTRCAAEAIRASPDATGVMLKSEDMPKRV